MPERDELDQLIDSALAGYAEPRPGLEKRVLARVSGQMTRSPRRRWILAAVAAPAIAALILFGYLVQRTPRSQPGQRAYVPAVTSEPAVVTTPTPPNAQRPASPERIRHTGHVVNRASNPSVSRPKLDIFPTPQPLTADEQALALFAAQAPEPQRKAFIEAQQQADAPIHIAAIRIQPLESPDKGKN